MPFSISSFGTAGLTQNLDKAVRQVSLIGPGSRGINRALAVSGGVDGQFSFKPAARYLGPHLHVSSSFSGECRRRIDAANRIWWMWRTFWRSNVDFTVKKIVFRCVIVQTVLSAVVAFVLQPTHYRQMQTNIVKRMRSLLLGAATTKYTIDSSDTIVKARFAAKLRNKRWQCLVCLLLMLNALCYVCVGWPVFAVIQNIMICLFQLCLAKVLG